MTVLKYYSGDNFMSIRNKKTFEGIDNIPEGQADGPVQKGCLVIEGGAFRGLYNQGVLDAFLVNGINVETVIGVSAGALAGMSYVAGQIGRSARVNLEYRHDSRYIGVKAIRLSHSLLNLDFLLKPNDVISPLNTERFLSDDRTFVAVATNCNNGETEYFTKDNCGNIYDAVKASATLPYLSPMVMVDDIPCLDGGCSCKIPYQWAINHDYEKIIIIKTRERGFRKAEKESDLAHKFYKKNPEFAEVLKHSNAMYNRQCDEIDELEKSGRTLVIAPSQPVTVSRLEKDMSKLGDLYWLGYNDALARIEEIKRYLEGENE